MKRGLLFQLEFEQQQRSKSASLASVLNDDFKKTKRVFKVQRPPTSLVHRPGL